MATSSCSRQKNRDSQYNGPIYGHVPEKIRGTVRGPVRPSHNFSEYHDGQWPYGHCRISAITAQVLLCRVIVTEVCCKKNSMATSSCSRKQNRDSQYNGPIWPRTREFSQKPRDRTTTAEFLR